MRLSKKTMLVGILAGLGIVVTSYAILLWIKTELPRKTPDIKQSQTCNFCLRVSNQSFEKKYVNIQVFIDDQLAIDDNFHVGDQHNYLLYKYNLAEGEHSLRIQSRDGNAEYEEKFTLTGKRDAIVTYGVKQRGNYFDKIRGTFKFEIYPEGQPVIII